MIHRLPVLYFAATLTMIAMPAFAQMGQTPEQHCQQAGFQAADGCEIMDVTEGHNEYNQSVMYYKMCYQGHYAIVPLTGSAGLPVAVGNGTEGQCAQIVAASQQGATGYGAVNAQEAAILSQIQGASQAGIGVGGGGGGVGSSGGGGGNNGRVWIDQAAGVYSDSYGVHTDGKAFGQSDVVSGQVGVSVNPNTGLPASVDIYDANGVLQTRVPYVPAEILRAADQFNIPLSQFSGLQQQLAQSSIPSGPDRFPGGSQGGGIDFQNLANGGFGTGYDWTKDPNVALKGPYAAQQLAANQQLAAAHGITMNPPTASTTPEQPAYVPAPAVTTAPATTTALTSAPAAATTAPAAAQVAPSIGTIAQNEANLPAQLAAIGANPAAVDYYGPLIANGTITQDQAIADAQAHVDCRDSGTHCNASGN